MDNNGNNNQGDALTSSPLKLDVTIRPLEQTKSNLLAFASVKIQDCFVVDGIKVVEGKNGVFIGMPSAKDSKGEYHDVAFPVTADFRQQLNKAVLDEYISHTKEKAQDKPSIIGQVNEKKNEIKERSSASVPAQKKENREL